MDFIKFGKINKAVANKAKAKILSENHFIKGAGAGTSTSNHLEKETIDNNNEKENIDEDDDIEPNSTAAKPKINGVKRPIICICNDLYAKVLTVLRKEALVFRIKSAQPAKLLQRLKEICIKESLKVDTSTLKNLCEKSNFDIRVCINSLQFISYNQNNVQLLKSISQDKLFMLGCKDISEGIFDVWSKLFTSSIQPISYNSVFNIYSSYGEFNRINEGLFVNYIKVPNKDNDLASRAKLLDYLSYEDIINKKIMTTQNYELMRFQALPGAYAKKKYSSSTQFSLEFPTLFMDYRKNKKANSRILGSIKESVNEEYIYTKTTKRSLVLDLLPYVFELLQPNIREFNKELLNRNELQSLKSTVNLMYSFGIEFHEASAPEDEAIYEPDIKKLLTYDYTFKNYRITPKQKLIIRNEYDLYKTFKDVKKRKVNNFEVNKTKSVMIKSANKDKLAENEEKPKNYFGMNTKRTFSQMVNQEVKFIYKFNEGYTNSVRRNLNFKYFLK